MAVQYLERHSGGPSSTVGYVTAGRGMQPRQFACPLQQGLCRGAACSNVRCRLERRRRPQALSVVWPMQVLLRPPGHSLGSQRVRVHRDVSRRPRSSGCPLPSRTTGSKRTAERRKLARRQLASTTRAPGWLALGSSLRQQGDRRVQFGRRAVKVWRAQGRGTVPVAH